MSAPRTMENYSNRRARNFSGAGISRHVGRAGQPAAAGGSSAAAPKSLRARIRVSRHHSSIPGLVLPTKQIPETLPKPQLEARAEMRADVVVIGSGPTGLACAIEAQKAGFKVISIDKGCLVNSLFHYPANMIFFTTPELLEIGDIPFSSANPKP